MEQTTKAEEDAVKLAQIIKEWALRIASPAYREMRRVQARDRRIKYLALIEAGFTEDQALILCTSEET